MQILFCRDGVTLGKNNATINTHVISSKPDQTLGLTHLPMAQVTQPNPARIADLVTRDPDNRSFSGGEYVHIRPLHDY